MILLFATDLFASANGLVGHGEGSGRGRPRSVPCLGISREWQNATKRSLAGESIPFFATHLSASPNG
jgi:hypothetical protein